MLKNTSFRPSKRRAAFPKYCLHKASGQAYVTLVGHVHYLGRYDSTESRNEYDRLISEWLQAGRPSAAKTRDVQGISINELLLQYLRYADQYYRKPSGQPSGEYDVMRTSIRQLKRLYGLTPANEFGPINLKAVQVALIEQGLTRQGVNRRISRIVRVFKWAVENELVDPMVHHALQQVPGLKRGRTSAGEFAPVRPVEGERVEAVRPHVARQVKAMIDIQRLTAMRPGEVCQMRSGDIDRSSDVWIYVPREHKTEHHGHEHSGLLRCSRTTHP